MAILSQPAAAIQSRRYDTKQIQALDSAHYIHPFTDSGALAKKGARVITRAEGVYIWDSENQKLFDAMSGLWCVNVGYGRKALADAAYQQMLELPYYNSFFQTTTEPSVRLAKLLADVTPPQFSRVFFSGSGSEGNDTVVRLVRHYWACLKQPNKKVIISRWNGYHGSTMAGASLGGMEGMHQQGGLPIPDITHIQQPYWFEVGRTQYPHLSKDEFGLEAASWLEKKILDIGVENVAAFIGEPIQGAGGVIIPPKTYWPEIQRICDKYGILLVTDEVICGFGRTGNWWGCETVGCKPDLMTFAKGVTSGYVPLGGVMVSDKIADVVAAHGDFNHGYTYSGHPVAAAVAVANINIIRDEDLVGQVREVTGPYLKAQFEALIDHPLVGEAETCGFMAGLVLVKSKSPLQTFDGDLAVGMVCRGHCFGNGLVMRAVGDRMIIAPPLITTKAQIDELIALIRKCLDLTYDDLQHRGWLG
ncbi:MAG: aspartate aminotransferase family protein [Burkholderiales bacterium]|nr:MAG: aspartate aminotransferase family protein [Betaproteobacteria bacterium]TAG24166.1 MAG: aspartate aminotransferase family protein [Burkholderiales bacterium]